MVECPGPEADQDGPLPLDHPFVEALSRLDLASVAEMLTADPGLATRICTAGPGSAARNGPRPGGSGLPNRRAAPCTWLPMATPPCCG